MDCLITCREYEIYLLMEFGLSRFSYEMDRTKPGRLRIVFHKQRFRAWWYRKAIRHTVEQYKEICANVILMLSFELWSI